MLHPNLPSAITRELVHELAKECGFDLVGITSAVPHPDFERYRSWAERGLAADMKYLTDHRAKVRAKPSQLLENVRTIICGGFVFSSGAPAPGERSVVDSGFIAKYASGDDYHALLKVKIESLAAKLLTYQEFSWKACVDTAPLLERSYAAQAGLGWIGKNTCLINEKAGSWILLGELLTTLEIPSDDAAPYRCGTCTKCISSCPTHAIVPSPSGGFELDSRLCISYFTIESRGAIPQEHREATGNNVFGCDICQDVCPWNTKAGRLTSLPHISLEEMAGLSPDEFHAKFRDTAVSRAKYSGFLRNVAVAMGNAREEKFRLPLERLAASEDPLISEHARWALARLP